MITNSVHTEKTVYNRLPSIIFAHGKESGPFGDKIAVLSDVAKSHGYPVAAPDFRGMNDPEERVQHLLNAASKLEGPYIFAGSSMGGYVTIRASEKLPTLGLFLMAPAVGIDNYLLPNPLPGCKPVTIIHAWKDEIIPVHNVIDYAERHQAELHIVNSDHRLSGQIPVLVRLFDSFIEVLTCNIASV